jgi:hypothetical protein
MRVRRRDILAAASLFALAFGLRILLVDSPPYGDESGHFAISKTMGIWGDETVVVAGDGPFDLIYWVAGRPVFAAVYAPGAWLGFDAFRIEAALVSSTIPVLGYAWLLTQGSRRILGLAAGGVLAAHPAMVVWGARVFPDSLMAALFLAGLLAWVTRRRRAALGFLFASCLAKETAIAAVGSLAVAQFLEERRLHAHHAGSLRLGAVALAGVLVVIFAALYAGSLTGWARGGDPTVALEEILWSSWLIVPILVGLFVRAARQIAVTLAGLVAFYVAYILLRDGALNAWYLVLPLCLATLLTAQLIWLGWTSNTSAWLASRIGAVSALFLALFAIFGGTPLAHPMSQVEDPGLESSIAFVRSEAADLGAARDYHLQVQPQRVFMVDVVWYNTYYPLGGRESTVISYPLVLTDATVPLEAMEEGMGNADLVWLQWWDGAFEQRFDAAFQGCRTFNEGLYRAYAVADCGPASLDSFWSTERGRQSAA